MSSSPQNNVGGPSNSSGYFVTKPGMKEYVNGKIHAINSYVGGYVDERLRRVSTRLNGHVMGATDNVAEKIGDIAESASGECAFDDTSPPNNLYLSKRRVRFMHDLRKASPETFEEMAAFAEKFLRMEDKGNDDSGSSMTKKSSRALLFMSSFTGFRSPVIESRLRYERQRGGDINGS